METPLEVFFDGWHETACNSAMQAKLPIRSAYPFDAHSSRSTFLCLKKSTELKLQAVLAA